MCLSFFLLTSACSEEKISSAAISMPSPAESILLLFLQEKQIEIWSKSQPKELLHAFQTEESIDQFPVGQFIIAFDSIHSISSFIAGFSEFNLKEVIVFPNDPRHSGQLEPCFACPHIWAEIYAKLEMLIHDYPINK
ncbi:MAG: hypothetical protein ACI8P3_001201 [Saprospiraceae bacterium]|jgi:hypothetical protein